MTESDRVKYLTHEIEMLMTHQPNMFVKLVRKYIRQALRDTYNEAILTAHDTVKKLNPKLVGLHFAILDLKRTKEK